MSSRPGRITDVIDIGLGERGEATRQSAGFFVGITAVRKALRGGHIVPDPEPAPAVVGEQ
jgi:NitT/TauT family transport system ATP-binding protein